LLELTACPPTTTTPVTLKGKAHIGAIPQPDQGAYVHTVLLHVELGVTLNRQHGSVLHDAVLITGQGQINQWLTSMTSEPQWLDGLAYGHMMLVLFMIIQYQDSPPCSLGHISSSSMHSHHVHPSGQ
jgi:hypothetical protein